MRCRAPSPLLSLFTCQHGAQVGQVIYLNAYSCALLPLYVAKLMDDLAAVDFWHLSHSHLAVPI